jgi:ATP-dependent Lhr-like helicase
VSFNRELQAAATDDGIVISLVEQHSFPIADVFGILRPAIVERELTQAVLASPFFTNRWRWNATRALAVMRHSGGKKVPVALQRMRAEDLLAAVFPEQVMCQDNQVGPIEIPAHPLVSETLRDCLYEALDMPGLLEILAMIESGEIETVAIDTPAPSQMAHEILNANPYAFLDDAPLEERRARAVSLRRMDVDRELGVLDPEAIQEVCKQAWPDVRDADELHDLLLGIYILPVEEREEWHPWADQLIAAGRATVSLWTVGENQGPRRAYVAAERWDVVRSVIQQARAEPPVALPLGFHSETLSEEEALRRIVGGWLDVSGPTTASALSTKLGLPANKIEAALIGLEASGAVLRGEFSNKGRAELEWCERGLLARIHRLTLGRMRKEIEPVSPADFMRFLFAWQHVTPDTRMRGRDGVLEVIRQLQGLELPAPAWEQHVLPARIKDYDPSDLEHLCLGGVVAWGRLRLNAELPEATDENANPKRRRRILAPTRTAPIAFLLREELEFFLEGDVPPWEEAENLSHMAREVGRYLEQRGASFLADVARGTGLLKVKAEEALWQLVAHGFATGDGIAGLRVLLMPEPKRAGRRRGFRVISGGRAVERLMPVGRWSLWRDKANLSLPNEKVTAHRAWQQLRRYGVIFRDLLARESCAPSWRSLLAIYRRLEARGEIRGGRFVNGFVGEQFALPEAVERLRAVRRRPDTEEPVIIASGDPLNLVGILTPGPRISPYSNQVMAFRNGTLAESGPLGAVLSRTQQLQKME